MTDTGDSEPEDLTPILNALGNNIPGLLEELFPTRKQKLRAKFELPQNLRHMNVLNLNGPIAAALMQTFATKVTFALYREIAGRNVPANGAVAVRWFSSYEHKTGGVPESVFQNLMPLRTLRQGKQQVANQFLYSFEISPDAQFARIVATFRYAFMVAGFISSTTDTFSDSPTVPVRPGELLSLLPKPSSSSGLR